VLGGGGLTRGKGYGTEIPISLRVWRSQAHLYIYAMPRRAQGVTPAIFRGSAKVERSGVPTSALQGQDRPYLVVGNVGPIGPECQPLHSMAQRCAGSQDEVLATVHCPVCLTCTKISYL
jgi:hypothetical protein